MPELTSLCLPPEDLEFEVEIPEIDVESCGIAIGVPPVQEHPPTWKGPDCSSPMFGFDFPVTKNQGPLDLTMDVRVKDGADSCSPAFEGEADITIPAPRDIHPVAVISCACQSPSTQPDDMNNAQFGYDGDPDAPLEGQPTAPPDETPTPTPENQDAAIIAEAAAAAAGAAGPCADIMGIVKPRPNGLINLTTLVATLIRNTVCATPTTTIAHDPAVVINPATKKFRPIDGYTGSVRTLLDVTVSCGTCNDE